MTLRDSAERILWTFVSAAGAGLATGPLINISALQAALLAGVTAVVNLVTLIARSRLAALPNPGGGLPGLGDGGGYTVLETVVMVLLVVLLAFLVWAFGSALLGWHPDWRR